MGLISTEVEVTLDSKTIKWYEEKGYEIPRWIDNRGRLKVKRGTKILVKIGDLPDGSGAKINVQCDGCGKLLEGIRWDNYNKYIKEDEKYYCQKCSNNLFGSAKRKNINLKKSISFYDWCYKNLLKEEADMIIIRWDENKNIDTNGNVLTPKDVSYSSLGFNRKGYWFKCLDNPEHESELKNISSFTVGEVSHLDCLQCKSIFITHPELIHFLVNKEDAHKYSFGSGKNVLMKCPDCGHEKELVLRNLVRQGFYCPKCSDGISYPNKLCFNFLEEIKDLNKIKDFETEKTFDWLKYSFKNKIRKGFLDFYFVLNDQKYVIEMDGFFHTNDNSMSGQTAEESKFIDNEKDRLCKEHDIIVIRIDSLKSELEYIKNNIINSNPSLPQLLNFKESDINWLKCHRYACNSFIKVVCDLWNSGIKNTKAIAEKIKLHNLTVSRYLKQGVELGWCNYYPKKSNEKYFKSKKVICLTTNEVFNSILEASKGNESNRSSISACCRGKLKSAGKHPETGEKMVWMYYEKYLELNK